LGLSREINWRSSAFPTLSSIIHNYPSLFQEYLHSSDEELDLLKPLILIGLNST
jgi:hypothetical protein